MDFKHIVVPEEGEKILFNSTNELVIPNNPIIPFIEGDGIGSDITPAMINVVDSSVSKAYKDIDTEKKGYIVSSDIGRFLNQSNITITKM